MFAAQFIELLFPLGLHGFHRLLFFFDFLFPLRFHFLLGLPACLGEIVFEFGQLGFVFITNLLAGALFLAAERDDLGLLLMLQIAVPVVLVTLASAMTIASNAYCLASMVSLSLLVGVACDRLLTLASRASRLAPAALLVSSIFVAQLYELAHYYTVYNNNTKISSS